MLKGWLKRAPIFFILSAAWPILWPASSYKRLSFIVIYLHHIIADGCGDLNLLAPVYATLRSSLEVGDSVIRIDAEPLMRVYYHFLGSGTWASPFAPMVQWLLCLKCFPRLSSQKLGCWEWGLTNRKCLRSIRLCDNSSKIVVGDGHASESDLH